MNNLWDKINYLPIPVDRVVVLLNSKYSCSGDLTVKIGDIVSRAQCLTKKLPGSNNIAIHSPIDGVISAIKDYPFIQAVPNSNNQIATTIGIEITACKQPAIKPSKSEISKNSNITINRENLSDYLSKYGILGMGGAGFPTAKKVANNNIKTLIINAVECEQPISVDNCLIINHYQEVISGIKKLQSILNPKETIIAVKQSMRTAINVLQKELLLSEDCKIAIKIVPEEYPNGYSKTVIELVTKTKTNPNKHSSELGILCLNAGTIYAINNALSKDMPLINRLITITGNIQEQGNYLLPIGTPFATILRAFHVNLSLIKNKKFQLVIKVGGRYMGQEVFNSIKSCTVENLNYLQHTGIDKTTQAIDIQYQARPINKDKNIINRIKQFATNLISKQEATACIRCGLCENACPYDLQPQQLYWFTHNIEQNNNIELLQKLNISNCIECGLCDTVCPSNLKLSNTFTYAKTLIKKQNHEKQQAILAKNRNEQRLTRIKFKEQQKYTVSVASSKKSKQDLLANALKRAKTKKSTNLETNQ